uniref:Uncharacterized protein n=1 Tax=Arundo donax TaxID=35708 RepID=A0A0A9BSL5_ARUDO
MKQMRLWTQNNPPLVLTDCWICLHKAVIYNILILQNYRSDTV